MSEAVAQFTTWQPQRSKMRAEAFLSRDSMAQSEIPTGRVAGFDLHASVLAEGDMPPQEAVRSAQVLIVEVAAAHGEPAEKLRGIIAERGGRPLIAALRDPSLNDVRSLMHLGISDVLPLPMTSGEIDTTLQRVRFDLERSAAGPATRGSLVPIIKARGGVGATMLLTQLACAAARRDESREVCLVDLDVQFGNAALYLGELPKIGVADLVEAGGRADGELLRTISAKHASGLRFLAAPSEIMSLDQIDNGDLVSVLDLLTAEFDTVFVDLPTSWTNWSLSVVAQADLLLLVSELSVAGLHRSKRQLNFLRQRDLGDIPTRIVMNRIHKRLFRTLDFADAERSLGQPVDFSIADDPRTVQLALDQGVELAEVDARSKAARDIAGIAEQLDAELSEEARHVGN